MLTEKQAAGLLNKITAWYFINGVDENARRDALPVLKDAQKQPNYTSDMWAKLMTDALVAFSEGLDDKLEPENRRASFDAAVEMIGTEAFNTVSFILATAATQLPIPKNAATCPSCKGYGYAGPPRDPDPDDPEEGGFGPGGGVYTVHDPGIETDPSKPAAPEDYTDPLADEPEHEDVVQERSQQLLERGVKPEDLDEVLQKEFPTDEKTTDDVVTNIRERMERGENLNIEDTREIRFHELREEGIQEDKIKEEYEKRFPEDDLEAVEYVPSASPSLVEEDPYHTPCSECEGMGFVEEEEINKPLGEPSMAELQQSKELDKWTRERLGL